VNHKIIHGHKIGGESPTYITWRNMKARCNDESNEDYHQRGIAYVPEWEDFENFLSDMGDRPEGMTLDRIDPDGDYCKVNCRWATKVQQQRNRRNTIRVTIGGVTLPLADWLDRLGVSIDVVKYRVRVMQMTYEQALLTPPIRNRKGRRT